MHVILASNFNMKSLKQESVFMTPQCLKCYNNSDKNELRNKIKSYKTERVPLTVTYSRTLPALKNNN